MTFVFGNQNGSAYTQVRVLNGEIHGSHFTCPQSGNLRAIAIYVYRALGGNVQCALYTRDTALGGTLVAVSEVRNFPAGGPDVYNWESFAITASVIAGQEYWLLVRADSNVYIRMVSSDVDPTVPADKGLILAATLFPSTIAVPFNWANLYSIYATGETAYPWHVTISVAPTGSGTTNPPEGSYDVPSGEGLTVTASPIGNYVFDYWLFDDNITTMPIPSQADDSSHTLVAVFTPVTVYYTLVLTQSIGGTISSPDSVFPTYVAGTVATINAVAATGYKFDHWLVDGASAGTINPLTLIMDANHIVEAVFVSVVPPYGTFGNQAAESYTQVRTLLGEIHGSHFTCPVASTLRSISVYIYPGLGTGSGAMVECAVFTRNSALTGTLVAVSESRLFPPDSAVVYRWEAFNFLPDMYGNYPQLFANQEYWLLVRSDSNVYIRMVSADVDPTVPADKGLILATASFPSALSVPFNWANLYSIYVTYGEQPVTYWSLSVAVYTDGVLSSAGGIVSPGNQTNISSKISVVETENVSNATYQFDGWTLDGTASGRASSITVGPFSDSATHTLRADFSTIPPPSVSIAPAGPLYILTGGSQQFIASVLGGQGISTVTWKDTGGGNYGTGTTKTITFPQPGGSTVTIYASAVDGAGRSSDSNQVIVNVTAETPNQLSATVTAKPTEILPNGATTITVTVMVNGLPVEGASVSFTTTGGGILSPSCPIGNTMCLTDSSGKLTTLFTDANTELVTIIATVTKSGYTNGTGSGSINVTTAPTQAGFPLWAIPVGASTVILVALLLRRGKSKK